jgi:hypothetical protein
MTLAEIPSDVIAAAQAAHKLYFPRGPFVSVTLAQWAVESAWGHDEPAGSDNPFGIKAVAGQPYVISMTREVINGISETIPQRFAKYASLTDAFEAHAKLLATSPIYAAAQRATNPDDYVRAMAPHYATAPNYAAVLLAVMRTQNLYRFDVPVKAQPEAIANTNPGAGTAGPAASGLPSGPATTKGTTMATSATSATTTVPTAPASGIFADLKIGLDMLQNFNFSQIGDAIETASSDPITAIEDVANIAVKAATVAGVPFAGTAEEFLPIAEGLVGFLRKLVPGFGGSTGQAAATATAISSPPALTPQALN